MDNNKVEIQVGVKVDGASKVDALGSSLHSTAESAGALGDKGAQSAAGLNQANSSAAGYAATSTKLRDGLESVSSQMASANFALNFKQYGTAIGEFAARLMGAKDRTEELAQAEKTAAAIAQDGIEQRKRMAAATQEAIDKQYDLSKAGKEAITEFDKMTKGGSSAAEAIAKIGKDFDLSSSPGIRDAETVLNKLQADGKISASEFQKAWSDALKGEDLEAFKARFQQGMLTLQDDADKAALALQDAMARGLSGAELKVFEDAARAALGAVAREADRSAAVMDGVLRESIKRAGLDFNLISGGMSKASVSAINDTQAMIDGLDRLKTMGVDTSQALTASIGKGIDTADSQQAIEAVKDQIELVRKALGDKVADGLLDQAIQKSNDLKDALDKATPGINSVREAMKTLGVTSDETFANTAAKSKEAYGIMKSSGTASARELQDAFMKYSKDALAASGEVGSSQRAVTEEALKSEAALRGLTIAFDDNGKMAVGKQGEAKNAIEKTTGAIDDQTTALEKENKAIERANAAREKALELELKRLGIDKDKFVLGSDGKRIEAEVNDPSSIATTLMDKGVDEEKAKAIAARLVDSTGQVNLKSSGVYQDGDTLEGVLTKLAKKNPSTAEADKKKAEDDKKRQEDADKAQKAKDDAYWASPEGKKMKAVNDAFGSNRDAEFGVTDRGQELTNATKYWNAEADLKNKVAEMQGTHKTTNNTYTVNIPSLGKSINVDSPSDVRQLTDLITALTNAKRTAGY